MGGSAQVCAVPECAEWLGEALPSPSSVGTATLPAEGKGLGLASPHLAFGRSNSEPGVGSAQLPLVILKHAGPPARLGCSLPGWGSETAGLALMSMDG